MKIFIVGCGRSGTTLMRTMLNHHKDVFIPLECLFITDYLKYGLKLSSVSLRKLVLGEPQLKIWFDPALMRDAAADSDDSAAGLIERIHSAAMHAAGKKYWGQKTPRFVRDYRLLKEHYPDIKFIFMYRDPRSVAASFKKSPGFNSSTEHAVRRWLNDNRAGLAMRDEFPDDTFSLKYEDLVTDTENVLKRVCTFLGLEYDPRMLEYHKRGDSEYGDFTKRISGQLNVGPNRNNIDKWRNQLSAADTAYIERHCRDLMETYGYAPAAGPAAPVSRISGFSVLLGWIPVYYDFIVNWPAQFYYTCYRKLRLMFMNGSLAPLLFK